MIFCNIIVTLELWTVSLRWGRILETVVKLSQPQLSYKLSLRRGMILETDVNQLS